MSNQVELTSKDQLNTIIVNKNGKPYKTAIEIYWEALKPLAKKYLINKINGMTKGKKVNAQE